MNSFQAVNAAGLRKGKGRITVTIDRDGGLLDDVPGLPSAFTIVDNGIGLNDLNMDSFNESYSEHKLNVVGKGLGRFSWLKAFDRVEIESTFSEADAVDHALRRKFIFDADYEPAHATPVRAPLRSLNLSARNETTTRLETTRSRNASTSLRSSAVGNSRPKKAGQYRRRIKEYPLIAM